MDVPLDLSTRLSQASGLFRRFPDLPALVAERSFFTPVGSSRPQQRRPPAVLLALAFTVGWPAGEPLAQFMAPPWIAPLDRLC